jgi:hypothetical protein
MRNAAIFQAVLPVDFEVLEQVVMSIEKFPAGRMCAFKGCSG